MRDLHVNSSYTGKTRGKKDAYTLKAVNTVTPISNDSNRLDSNKLEPRSPQRPSTPDKHNNHHNKNIPKTTQPKPQPIARLQMRFYNYIVHHVHSKKKQKKKNKTQYRCTDSVANLHSVRKEHQQTTENTIFIELWFKLPINTSTHQQQSWRHDNLIHNAYSKKKKTEYLHNASQNKININNNNIPKK